MLIGLIVTAVTGFVAWYKKYLGILKGLWRQRPIQMLVSSFFVFWSFALIEEPLIGPVYRVFSYLPWPWRSIVAFVIGASWPIVTLTRGEHKSRDILGIQSVLLIYMAFHMIDSSTVVQFFLCMTLGVLAFDQRGLTPVEKPTSSLTPITSPD